MGAQKASHVEFAETALASADNWEGTEKGNDLRVEALVHATLALVEQQRIANLIALGQFRVGVDDLPHLRHLVIQPKGEHSIEATDVIREGLGL